MPACVRGAIARTYKKRSTPPRKSISSFLRIRRRRIVDQYRYNVHHHRVLFSFLSPFPLFALLTVLNLNLRFGYLDAKRFSSPPHLSGDRSLPMSCLRAGSRFPTIPMSASIRSTLIEPAASRWSQLFPPFHVDHFRGRRMPAIIPFFFSRDGVFRATTRSHSLDASTRTHPACGRFAQPA